MDERGLSRFTAAGFPTTALEDWKYTNVTPLSEQEYRMPAAQLPHGAGALTARARLRSGVELVFVNGRFAPSLSSTTALPKGALVSSLADALRTHPELIEPHLGRYAGF